MRTAPNEKPNIYPGGTGQQFDSQSYQRFLFACASDPRFTPAAILQELEYVYDFSWLDTLLYRAPPPDAAPAPAAVESHPGAIHAPMVGTVYLTPEPGATPFVSVGDEVHEGQTLLIIEAMKVMNPIRAPRSGRLIQLAVGSGDPVEYGELLMIIE
jgi:hypothetical protein